MKTHELKCWPSQFADIKSGVKTFEYRRNDRDFSVGDVLKLREWVGGDYVRDPDRNQAAPIFLRVTHILHGGRFEIPIGYCIMSIETIEAP